jgi:hypothetical protein
MKRSLFKENYQSLCFSQKDTLSSISPQSNHSFKQLIIERKPYFLESDVNLTINSSSNDLKKHIIPQHNNIKTKFKNKQKFMRNSSEKSSFCSESDSYSSTEIRKRKVYDEESFNYPTRSEVGLFTSDDDSQEMDSQLKDNLENEIETILIEVYNKNISSSTNNNFNNNENCNYKNKIKNYYHNMRNYNKKYKQKSSLENSKNELKLTFKQLNEQYNFFVLQILSKKMKELINKYKEKIFEISDISKIYKNYQRKQNNESNNDLSHEYFSINSKNKNNQNNNNSNNNTQNSLLISQIKNKKNYHYLLELVQKEINENKITDTLLRELINIKETLQQSSFEINQIFKYPLSLLKTKFSMEQIQLEAFNKILVKDELISTLLFQIKVLFQNSHNKKFLDYVAIIEDDKNYSKNEMVKFDQLLEEKLKNKSLINSINNINNNNNPSFLYNNSNSTKAQSDICDDEMSNGSNEEIIIKQNFNNYRKNILTNSVSSTQSQSNSNGNNQNLEGNNNEKDMKFVDKNIDIDTLVKIIDSQEDICTHKKKKKKKNKNKNKKTLNNINLGVKIYNNINNNDNNISNNNNSFNNLNNSKNDESDFENVFKDFKEDITKNSLYIYETNKMKCNISSNFLLKLFTKK